MATQVSRSSSSRTGGASISVASRPKVTANNAHLGQTARRQNSPLVTQSVRTLPRLNVQVNQQRGAAYIQVGPQPAGRTGTGR